MGGDEEQKWSVGYRVRALGGSDKDGDDQQSRGTVMYVGTVPPTSGLWLGVDWDDESRGKHSGCHEGVSYFKARTLTSGSFIRPTKVSAGIGLIQALSDKYLQSSPDAAQEDTNLKELRKQMNAPHVTLVGFDAVRKEQSDFRRLVTVNLEHSDLRGCLDSDEGLTLTSAKSIRISRTLVSSWEACAQICLLAPRLESLHVKGNRFLKLTGLPRAVEPLQGLAELKEINIGNMGIDDWAEVEAILSSFPNRLRILHAPFNLIRELNPESSTSWSPSGLLANLEELDLSCNPICDWDAVTASLGALPKLSILALNGCPIQRIRKIVAEEKFSEDQVPFPELQILQLSDCSVQEWHSVAALDKLGPKLTILHFRKNPVMETEKSPSSARLMVIALTPSIRILNGVNIEKQERIDADIHYWRKYGHDFLMAKSKDPETLAAFFAEHPRYPQLIIDLGEPCIQTDPVVGVLKSSLLELEIKGSSIREGEEGVVKKVPKTLTAGKLKLMVQRLTRPPLKASEFYLTVLDKVSGTEVELDNDLRELDYYSVQSGNIVLVKTYPA